jgi:hypothetical protein
MSNEKHEIVIETEIIAVSVLKNLLENQRDWAQSEVFLNLRKSALKTRGLDTTILVALVGVAGSAIGVLISGILQIVKEKHLGKIILQGKNGQKIEVPATTSLEDLDKLVRKVTDLERVRIDVE